MCSNNRGELLHDKKDGDRRELFGYIEGRYEKNIFINDALVQSYQYDTKIQVCKSQAAVIDCSQLKLDPDFAKYMQ